MNWKRYTILALLFLLALSLRLAWSALTWQPEVAREKRGAAGAVGVAGIGIKVTRPPSVVPDLLDGYVFNAERKLDPAETLAFGGGNERAARGRGNIDKLLYSGSIMVGVKQQALVSFPAKIRGPKGRDKEIIRHRVLAPGDDFNGYKVASVEPLRLVFTLNGEKVVKQLYDKDKLRTVVSSASDENKQKSPPRVVAVPAIKVPKPVRSKAEIPVSQTQSRVRVAAPPGVAEPLSRSSRRMRRLKLENPDIIVPAIPGGALVPAATAPSR